MSKPSSGFPSTAPTPVPSSPPPSESFFSDIDGTAPSVLETSVGDYAWDASKTDSSTFNLVSWKHEVDARIEDGVERRGFNAISTVLNHPTKKANPLRSTRKPLPPLTQTPPVLPKQPLPSHYDTYLQSVTPLYDSFMAAQASSSSLAKSVPPSIHDPKESRRAATPAGLPPLDSVPSLFFEPTFDLANPSTWSAIVDGPVAGPSKTLDEGIQDALSSLLDTLERHLVHEITLRSSAFFSALSNLQDLHSESTSCLSRIADLQSSLEDVGIKQARKGLEIIDAQERLRVLRVTEKGIKTVSELDELMKVAQGLVDAGDWAAGLGCLNDVMKWWEKYGLHEESPQSNGDAASIQRIETSTSGELPLATLPALSSLPHTIFELTNSISMQLQAPLKSLLLSILDRTGSQPSFSKEDFRQSVEAILVGIVRCGQVGTVEEVWRDVMTTSMREGSRKHLPLSHAEEEGDEEGRPPETRGANLAEALRSMDHSQYLLLSTEMFNTLLSRLHLARAVGDVISEIIESFGSLPIISISSFVPDPSSNPTKLPEKRPVDLTDVIASACELANFRASKILSVRSEQHAALSLDEFVEIFKEHWDFVVATETLAQRMIVSLRGVTAAQARAFLVAYHSSRLTQSANMVQEEQWTQIDVSPPTQHIVNLLIEAAVSDPRECTIPPLASPKVNSENGATASKVLNVEEKTFFVVKATAESLNLLGDYLKIVINLELVTTDVMSRIIEFLKSFNSRTCQVVLGAGAMRSAGLKNITAKHLALASQSLSIIVSLIPYIREFIRRHLSLKEAVMLTEFDKLKRDYQEHQNEIHAKLVAIMSDRLAVHIGSLREIDWEVAPNKDGPTQHAEMLVKETATLHKVLSKYLALPTVEAVLSEVLAAIVHRLGEEYTKIELKSDDAKKRMMRDVALLNARLTPLSSAGKTVNSLETLVKDKSTPRRPIGQAMKGMLKRVNSGSMPKSGEENGSASSGECKGEATEETRKSGEDEDVLTIEEPKQVEDIQDSTGKADDVKVDEDEMEDSKVEGSKVDEGIADESKIDDSKVEDAVPLTPIKEELQPPRNKIVDRQDDPTEVITHPTFPSDPPEPPLKETVESETSMPDPKDE